jgi:hypothetical protein
MDRRSASAPGDKAALFALVGMLVLFTYVVGKGWHGLFASQGIWISFFAGSVVALIAVALSYAIASERTHHPKTYGTAASYFFVLFNISALGTVNFMFTTFQSSNVFRDQVDQSTAAIVALRDYGVASIDTSEYDKFIGAVSDRMRNLRAELENPQLCGQGEEAERRISEIQALLPNFRKLAGGGKCERIPLVVATYEKQVAELLRESSQYKTARQRVELKSKLANDTAKLLDEVNAVAKDISGSYSSEDVRKRLFGIADRYSLRRQELGTQADMQLEKIPLKVDTKSISALGDIGQVLPFMFSRLSDISTYLYLLIAVVIDVALVSAFARVLRASPTSQQKTRAARPRKI